MDSDSDSERKARETLQEAAKAAADLLPTAERLLAEAQRQVNERAQMVANLRAVVTAGGHLNPKTSSANVGMAVSTETAMPLKSPAVTGMVTSTDTPLPLRSLAQRAEEIALSAAATAVKQPQVFEAIDDVLREQGPLTFLELRGHLKRRGVEPADSTLYGYLGRGKTDGRYLNRSNKWELVG